MCKKTAYLLSLVLILGSVSSAEDIKWTDLGADHLWSNPENWDLGRVPTAADDVLIDAPAAAEPNGPVIQEGIAAEAHGIWTEAAGQPTLTMTGGSLVVGDWIWWGDGADSFGVWTMSGGTVDVADEFELGWGGGAGTLTLTGGTINAGRAVIPTDTGAFGELFLNGGIYNVTKADGLKMNATGLIDITEGMLVLEGDDTAKVNDLIAAGQITAYGGAGEFELDFGVRNPGNTTLTAFREPATGPIRLDIGNSPNAEELEKGFVPFTIADSGSEVDGVKVELGGTLDSRRRSAPTGVPFEQIYRDFIFSRPGGMTVTLSGLAPNTSYVITIYTWDTSSVETRVADWTANGEFIFQTRFDGAQNPPAAKGDYAFTGKAITDSTGTILLESAAGEGTHEPSGASHPFAFLNALVLELDPTVVFLSEDFESYADDAGLAAAGWTILDTPAAIEASTWTVTNPGGRGNPATLDGSASTGRFLISDSDQQSESNPVDSGASHDVSTPSFSTLGSATVWLHVDVSAQLNDNGAAIFDVEVSTDGGGSWTNVFSRVSPGRISSNGATTRLPDNTNADGYFGLLDVDISAVAADQADVRVRFRHYEPNWDWWIAIDNIVVDNVAAPQGGSVTVFSEDFSNGLGQMNVVSGQGNTGTETWHTTDKGGRYVPGAVGQRGVNRLGPHPNEHPEFAIIDSDADPDPAEDEWLMTPWLDLSGMAEVFLHYESETVMSGGVVNQEVLVSIDGGTAFEAAPIFAYTGGGLFDNGEEPVYAARIFDVSETAAGQSQVVFAFRYTGDGDDWWWAIDNVMVTGTPEPVDPGTEGLAAFYALENDVLDSSGNGNDGTVIGTAAFVEGPAGYGMAMELDGESYVDCGNDASLNIPGPFSAAIWIKPNANSSNTCPLSKADSGAAGWSWQLRWGWNEGKGTTMGWQFNANGSKWIWVGELPQDEWSHIAASHDGATVTCYLNGTATDSLSMGAITGGPTSPLLLGSDGWRDDWIGAIDEVAIYNRALSDGEIRYLAGN